MSEVLDAVVVGGGAMGLAAAWRLAGRGRSVRMFEQFGPGHDLGASHGSARNYNEAYADDDHQDLLRSARGLWRELEVETGTTLLDLVGLVNAGPRTLLEPVREAHERRGLAAAWVPAQEAAQRWPGLRLGGDLLLLPGSGRVRSADALVALATAAGARGARLAWGTPVRELVVRGDDEVVVVTDTERVRARRVVVAVGAWTTRLLSSLLTLPPLVVTEEQPAHFPAGAGTGSWPSFNQYPDPDDPADEALRAPVYGMLTPGEGVKVGFHGTGAVTDPGRRDRRPDRARLEPLQQYVRERVPGVDADRPSPISCTYTSTRTGDFVLERVGPLVVAAGFSGHGFKFTPAVGEVLAELVDGRQSPARFRPGLQPAATG